MNRYFIYILSLILVAGIFSCTEEELEQTAKIPAGQEHQVRVRLQTSDFVMVRSLTESDENRIDSVWVAQFDESGHRVANSMDGISYVYPADGIFTITATTSGANDHKLYFVTNMFTDPFAGVNEESDFLAKSYEYDDLVHTDRLVMVGVCETALTGNISTHDMLVYIDRLAAKLEIIVQADLDKLGNFQNKKIAVKSIKIGSTTKEMKMGDGSKSVTDTDVYDLPEVTFSAPDPSSSSSFFIYKAPIMYVLENMHGDLGNSQANEKNNFAPLDSGKDIATYLLITAEMDNGEKQGIVEYKVYLGDDASRNFDITRNTHYTITVTLIGNTSSDFDARIETDKLATLRILKPDGTPATTRESETILVESDVTSWDGGGYYINSGNENWSFSVTVPSGNSWASLRYQSGGFLTTDAYVNGNNGDPNGKFVIVMEPNLSALQRTATIEFFVVNNGITYKRIWKITQKPNTNLISIPTPVFIQSNAGYYAIPVRAAVGVEWKCKSSSDATNFKIQDHITNSGIRKGSTGSVDDGSGLIILDVNQYTGTSPGTERTTTLKIDYRTPGETSFTELSMVVRQLPAKSVYTGTIYNYQSSTSSPYEELILSGTAMRWAINDLGDKYLENSSLLSGVSSKRDGDVNTYKIYEKLDKRMIVDMPKGGYTMAGFSAITPAGACAMLNDSFDPNATDGGLSGANSLKWYLPANYEGIWNTTSSLFFNDARGRTYWSSTVEASGNRYGAYTLGAIDITLLQGNPENGLYVRCVRKTNPVPAKTYPYMSINAHGEPIIVTKENISGTDHGYTSTTVGATSTIVGYPLRFTQKNPDGTPGFGPDGTGPIKSSENTLAPKFQVASKDISGTNVWLVASGWNASVTDFADPKTGCAAYNEGGYSDWRLPTNAELRIMALLGAGINAANLPNNPGSDSFSSVSGFVRMSGTYLTGRDYIGSSESGTRVYYVAIDADNIRGSAVFKTNTNRARCVRDIK